MVPRERAVDDTKRESSGWYLMVSSLASWYHLRTQWRHPSALASASSFLLFIQVIGTGLPAVETTLSPQCIVIKQSNFVFSLPELPVPVKHPTPFFKTAESNLRFSAGTRVRLPPVSVPGTRFCHGWYTPVCACYDWVLVHW
jgi:hypothetical protein